MGAQSLYTRSETYLKPTGIYANIGAYVHGYLWTIFYVFLNWFLPVRLGGVPREYRFWSTKPNREMVNELSVLVEKGSLKILVDSIYDFDDYKSVGHVLAPNTNGRHERCNADTLVNM